VETNAHAQPISGDVGIIGRVRVNEKGGSMSAILKKPLRERLGEVLDHLDAASLDFGDGSVALLLRADGGTPVHVRSIGGKRFEISIQDDDDEDVDELTAAFLRLKIDQFKKGRVELSSPYTAEMFAVHARESKVLESEIAGELKRIAAESAH
jgi:hypothetical protein